MRVYVHRLYDYALRRMENAVIGEVVVLPAVLPVLGRKFRDDASCGADGLADPLRDVVRHK